MNTKKFMCEYFGKTKQIDKETGELLTLDEFWNRYLHDRNNTMQDIKVVTVSSIISNGALYLVEWGIGAIIVISMLYLLSLPVNNALNGFPELVGITGALCFVGLFMWFAVILVVVSILLYYAYQYLDKKEICRCIDKE